MINAKTRSIKAQAHTHAPTHTYADFFLECVRFVRSFIVRFVLFRFVSRVFLVVVAVVVLLYGNKWAELPTALPRPCLPSTTSRLINWFCDVIVVCVALRTFYAHFLFHSLLGARLIELEKQKAKQRQKNNGTLKTAEFMCVRNEVRK